MKAIVARGRSLTIVYKAGDEVTLSSEHEIACLRDLGLLVDPNNVTGKPRRLSKEALKRLESFPLRIHESVVL
jgi:hypothetical protein